MLLLKLPLLNEQSNTYNGEAPDFAKRSGATLYIWSVCLMKGALSYVA